MVIVTVLLYFAPPLQLILVLVEREPLPTTAEEFHKSHKQIKNQRNSLTYTHKCACVGARDKSNENRLYATLNAVKSEKKNGAERLPSRIQFNARLDSIF